MGTGIAQLAKSRRIRAERPTYEIPQEVRQSLAMRQATLNARAPGAVQAERNIMQNQSSTLNNIRQGAGDSSSLLAAAGAVQGTAQRGMRALAAQEEQGFYSRLAGLERAQSQMGAYRDKEFQLNEYEPFQDAMATKSALMEGGLRNINDAVSDVGATAGKYYQLEQMAPGFNSSLFNLFRRGQPSPMGYARDNVSRLIEGAGIEGSGAVDYQRINMRNPAADLRQLWQPGSILYGQDPRSVNPLWRAGMSALGG